MTAPSESLAKLRWHWPRFSLVGLFVLIFGIAVGLAYHRTELTHIDFVYRDTPHALTVSFLTWFALGMLQRAWQGLRRFRTAPSTIREIRGGQALDILWPLFVLGLMGIGVFIEATRHLNWGWHRDFGLGWAWIEIGEVFLALAVVCGYALPMQWVVVTAASRPRTWFWISEGLGTLVGSAWLLWVIFDLMLLPALVHAACISIRVGLPHYTYGHRNPLPDITPELLRNFLIGSACTVSLALVNSVLLVALGAWCHRSRTLRYGLVALWLASIVPLGLLLAWCKLIALPQLSPFFEGLYLNDSWFTTGMATALLLSATLMLTVRLTMRLRPDLESATASARLPSSRCIHERLDVMLVPVVAAAWIFIAAWQRIDSPAGWRVVATNLAMEFLYPLDQIASLAALSAILVRIWRRFRPPAGQPAAIAIDPAQFAGMAAMSLVTCAIVPPALAWFGFGLLFW